MAYPAAFRDPHVASKDLPYAGGLSCAFGRRVTLTFAARFCRCSNPSSLFSRL